MTSKRKTRRWVASDERMLTGTREQRGFHVFEKEFSDWIETSLPKSQEYHNISQRDFQRLGRILSVDVEFDHDGLQYPAFVPTFDGWVVVQVKRVDRKSN